LFLSGGVNILTAQSDFAPGVSFTIRSTRTAISSGIPCARIRMEMGAFGGPIPTTTPGLPHRCRAVAAILYQKCFGP
jgi:hypothetical protein